MRVVVKKGVSVLRRMEAEEPGLLTLSALGGLDGDLALMVADDLGQVLPEGFIDYDLKTAPGGEYGAVALTGAGTYFVVLRSYGDGMAIDLFASFHPLEGLVPLVADPHGRPDQALPIKAAIPLTQGVDLGAGDVRDWYRFVASRDGVVRFRTRVSEDVRVNLEVETYAGQDFTWPVTEGDRDEGGRQGNERADLAVSEGEVVYVRVNAWSAPDPVEYTIEARWLR